MLSLILFRHGKADRSDPRWDDRQRPLTQRGIREARAMGEFLASARQVPELALTSPARRACDTLGLAMKAGEWRCPSRMEEALYTFDVEDLVDFLCSTRDLPSSLLITGHQPALSELAAHLIDGGRLHCPTAAMARIDLDVTRWSDLYRGCGALRWLLPPKLLRHGGWARAE